MRILVTNDDGIDSTGLRLLADTARRYGEVFIIAPDGQRSASSHSFTYNKPVIIRDYDYKMENVTAYTCSGTPADCVRTGMIKVLPERPDFVFAGINTGYNICWDIQYSGTLGAAMEGSFIGAQAIAFSQGSPESSEVAETYLDELMRECMSKPLGIGKVWNVNFPDCTLSECRGIKRNCRVSTDRFYEDDYEMTLLEDGSKSLMIAVGRNWKASSGTDLEAVMGNYISVGIVNNIGIM